MYTIQSRYRWGPQQRLSLSGGSVYPAATVSYSPLVACESSYSWRTGKRASGPTSVPYNAIVRGSLVDKIRRRTEYTNALLQSYSGTGSSGSPTHFSLTDVGHTFAVAKKYITMISSRGSWADSYGGVVELDAIPLNPLPGDSSGNTMSGSQTWLSFPWGASSPGLSPFSPADSSFRPFSSGDLIKLQQDLITGLNPYRGNNSAMTAILELLKGDLPRAFGNLTKFSTEMKYLHPADRMKLVDQMYKESVTSPGATDLNIRFGWAPLVSDIKTLIEACIRLDSTLVEKNARRKRRKVFKKIDFYEETSGWRRNQFGFPTFGSYDKVPHFEIYPRTLLGSTLNSSSSNSGPGVSYAYTAGKGMQFLTQEVSYTFSARYSNGVRTNPTLDAYAEKLMSFLGLEITPEVIYDLTPWTWLLDWFTSLGSTVKFLSDFGLRNNVVNYAYFTQYVTTTRGKMLWNLSSSGALFPQDLVMVKEVSKEIYREAASPLGFGVSWSTLSESQLGILTALGLIRKR